MSMPATAQQAPAAAAEPEPVLQEVVVTGSRIPVPANISATSPTTIVSSQEIQLQGHTDITDVINALPQNIIGSNADFGNTSSPLTSTGGFSTVDLRGLGPHRTLVRVNGLRLGAGDPSTTNQNDAPDIDQIPAPLIERVDVVNGGASATYGSDAIAGVVNFIMTKDFPGIQIDGQYGFNDHDQHNSYVEDLLTHDDPHTGFTHQDGGTPRALDGVIPVGGTSQDRPLRILHQPALTYAANREDEGVSSGLGGKLGKIGGGYHRLGFRRLMLQRPNPAQCSVYVRMRNPCHAGKRPSPDSPPSRPG